MTETQLEWPADLGYATLVGRFGFMDADGPDEDREPDITPATSGTVLITPSVDTVKYDGELGPMLLIKRRVEGVIDADGYLATKNSDGTPGPRGIVVPATDADVQPTGFTYSVRISLASSGTVASYSIKAPTDAVVDLAKATPVASSGGTVTVVDYTSAERAETAAITAVQARDDAIQASQTATTAAGIADTRATDASTSASTASDILAQTQALGITVDTSVGTRVYVGNTMIHGDTGWRKIPPHETWSEDSTCMIRRVNQTISLNFSGWWLGDPRDIALARHLVGTITGFRPPGYLTLGIGNRTNSGGTILNTGEVGMYSTGSYISLYRLGGQGEWQQGDRARTYIAWTVNEPWPTTLPGTPA